MGTKYKPERTQGVVRYLCSELLNDVEEEAHNDFMCVKWNGTNTDRQGRKKSGYGRIVRSINGVRHELLIQHIVWMATQTPTATLVPGPLSHLCHDPLCVNRTHIIYEPMAVNHQRKECNRAKRLFIRMITTTSTTMESSVLAIGPVCSSLW